MKVFISEKFLMFDGVFRKGNYFYSGEISIDILGEILKETNKKEHIEYLKQLEEPSFVAGMNCMLKSLETSKEISMFINKIEILLNSKQIQKFGEVIMKLNQTLDIEKDDFKAIIQTDNFSTFSEELFFTENPNINVIVVHDDFSKQVHVITRKGFEVYDKKVFFNIKQKKNHIVINSDNILASKKLFELINKEDLVDKKAFEKDSFVNITNYCKRNPYFFKSMEDYFMKKLSEIFGIKIPEDESSNLFLFLFDMIFETKTIKDKSITKAITKNKILEKDSINFLGH